MILAVLVCVFIGALTARATKGMNVGNIAFGLWVVILSAIASGLIGMVTNAVGTALLSGIVAGLVSFVACRLCR